MKSFTSTALVAILTGLAVAAPADSRSPEPRSTSRSGKVSVLIGSESPAVQSWQAPRGRVVPVLRSACSVEVRFRDLMLTFKVCGSKLPIENSSFCCPL
ncbi:hypothetical protein IF1G_05502 [Cordyceps javanica]|uniref:Uncharacterized protein n=1 Tax=Cordyceps javanica TaxID=43265 RepID=A0A545V1V4_9HYPO|nr:hypothetical protein IF1G_05502 [Cordyceps javanica]